MQIVNKKEDIMSKLFKIHSLKLFSLTALVALFTVALNAQDIPPQQESQDGKNLVQVVKANDDISEFADLLDKSGYADILEEGGPFTILAPNNDAIKALSDEDKENPQELLQGQLFQGNVPKDLVESELGVKVEKTDDSATNGIVYIVDKINESL